MADFGELNAEQTYAAGLRLLEAGCSIIPVYTAARRTSMGMSEPKRPHREALIETGNFELVYSEKRQREEQVARWLPFQSQRADAALVQEWVRVGARGWGLVTGAISGLVAIDFDAEGQRLFDLLDWRPHTLTPSGGQHVFVRHPGWRVKTAKSLKKVREEDGAQLRLPPGVDVRGDGGYVVAPPTVTEAGRYRRTIIRSYLERDAVPELVEIGGQRYLFRAGLTLDMDPEVKAAQEAAEVVRAGELERKRTGFTGKRPDSGKRDDREERANLGAILARAIELGQTGRNDGAFYLGCQLRDNDYTLSEALELYDTYDAAMPMSNSKGKREAFTREEFAHAIGNAFRGNKRKPWKESADRQRRRGRSG